MRWNRRMFVCVILSVFCMLTIPLCGCKEEAAEIEMVEIVTEDSDMEPSIEQPEEKIEEETKEIYVFVCGEVKSPGVYKMSEGERITHALFAAGGMTDQAADTFLNQAELLTDGQKIYVPNKEEIRMHNSSISLEEKASDGKININTAEKSQLTTLSGIGASRADAIITYREMNGKFSSIDDIKKVDGIKDGIYQKIKDQIKVE